MKIQHTETYGMQLRRKFTPPFDLKKMYNQYSNLEPQETRKRRAN